MPTENEIKYVLKISDDVQQDIMMAADSCRLIRQAYFNTSSNIMVRVREELGKGGPDYFFQSKVNAGGRVIEVSTRLSERDFKDLWKKTKGSLSKIRYFIITDTHDLYQDDEGKPWKEKWDVDFMRAEDGQTYFSVAEVEIPEGVEEPLFVVPDVIRNNTVFRVPQGDSRFSNSRLVDVEYATKLYTSLFTK